MPRGLNWRPWLGLLGLAVLVKAVIVTAALTQSGAGSDLPGTIIIEWNRWDAPHYLAIAANGYSSSGDARNFIAFFPLYPALIQALGAAGLPLPWAALALSNGGSLVATILLYEIGCQGGDRRAAWRAAALFTLFPTAYFLFTGYTEGIFCALAFGSVLAARRHSFLAAGMLGGLAAASRLTGIALLPLLALELWAARQAIRQSIAELVALGLVPLGVLVYLAINWLALRSPFAFVAVQQEHWYHRLSPPWTGLLGAFQSMFWRPPWERVTVGACELVAGLGAYVVTGLSWARLRPGDTAYALVLTVLTTFLPFWLSIPRYLLGLYPLFLLAGRIQSRFLNGLIASFSISMLLLFSAAFARGFWAF